MSNTTVYLIRCFDGERHHTLERVWRAFVEYQKDLTLVEFENPGCVWPHASALAILWAREAARKNGRYVIVTEYDFLPDFERFAPVDLLDERGILCAEYVNGVGGRNPSLEGIPGAWYMLFDKERCGELDFSPGGPFHDPAFGLPAKLLPATPMYPAYPGAAYETGEHLFWQRHLHDSPEKIVGREKMNLGWMQNRHDRRVFEWLRAAPKAYRKIYNRMRREDEGQRLQTAHDAK